MKSTDFKSKLIKVNTPPGSILYTGDKSEKPSYIELISYNEKEVSKKRLEIEDIKSLDSSKINWINVVGVNDIAFIKDFGAEMEIDALVLEDITTIGGRAKHDEYGDYTFVLLSMILTDAEQLFREEQLSIIIKNNMIITFQEIEGDMFGYIRKEIQDNEGRIRKSGAAYLLYSIIDAVVDQYFFIMNEIDKRIEDLEEEIMGNTSKEQAKQIYAFRRNIMELKTTMLPMKDIIRGLTSDDDLFSKAELKYLNDVNDNISQIMDSLSTYRDLIMGLYEIYLSNISNKMNRIMTTLTIISVIFIPLTFLSSVYGMNFEYLPELEWKWGYFGFWSLCAFIFVSMFVFFKRKDWFL